MVADSGVSAAAAPSRRYDSRIGNTAALSLPRLRMRSRLGSSPSSGAATLLEEQMVVFHSRNASSTRHSLSGLLRSVVCCSSG